MPLIFLLEDDPGVRELTRYACQSAGFEVMAFEMPTAFFHALGTAHPDLLLLDIMLPEQDGFQVLARLRKGAFRTLPVILLTAKGQEHDKLTGLDLGADDYITKPFSVLELIARIRALLRRTNPLSDVLQYEGISLDPKRHTVCVQDALIQLTHKEFDLLSTFLREPSVVLTREILMNAVWGTDYLGDSRTVDMHIKTLRKKLGTAGALLQTVRGVGYVLRKKV